MYDVQKGEYVPTEVVPIKSKKYLKQFNRRTGWYVNWSKFDKDISIFAVVDKNFPDDVQGLIATSDDTDARLLHIAWSCVAPHNDVWAHKEITEWTPRYKGVGGHLLAIAANESCKMGYDGACHAEAMDAELLKNHIQHYDITPTPLPMFPFHFGISSQSAKQIIKKYDYETNNRIFK